MSKVRVLIMGAAGRDFHNFNMFYRDNDAYEVITCGAVNSFGGVASFSVDGPTADGRVKPEVLAFGVGTATVDANDDAAYVGASGTSMSTPLVASAVVLLVQAHPDWTVAQIRTALTLTSNYYTANGTYDPTYVRGYGIIDALAANDMPMGGGDREPDGDLDLLDFAGFQSCFSGDGNNYPDDPSCSVADFDGDGDVDSVDFVEFYSAMWPT